MVVDSLPYDWQANKTSKCLNYFNQVPNILNMSNFLLMKLNNYCPKMILRKFLDDIICVDLIPIRFFLLLSNLCFKMSLYLTKTIFLGLIEKDQHCKWFVLLPCCCQIC